MAFPAMRMMAAVDPNFYIYICFGQSNMEGNAQPEAIDKTGIDKRFRLLATCKFDSPSRNMGAWYKATPPLVSPNGGLGPTDYFGRMMCESLPDSIRIGVIPVAMGGSPIEMFDKDTYEQKMSQNPDEWWAILARNHYGGNPYGRIIEMAKKAQKVGVIKGILLHQGCSNNGDPNWPSNVKKIYDNILSDLELKTEDVPLFVGETLRQENGGSCYAHNTQVARMPKVITNSYVISSEGCPGNGQDPWHFSAVGYRIMGKRYAFAALGVLGVEPKANSDYQWPTTSLKNFYTARTLNTQGDLTLKCGSKQKLTTEAVYKDGHKEKVTSGAEYSVVDGNITITNSTLTVPEPTNGSVETAFTDFTGQRTAVTFSVESQLFPFNKDNIRTTVTGAIGTYDETTRTFYPGNNGKQGQMGWVYDSNVDLSKYKYLVVKLKEPQTCNAHLNIFQINSANGSGLNSEDFGDKTLIVVPLQGALITTGPNIGNALNTQNIRIVSFWGDGNGEIKVEDVFVTNNEQYNPSQSAGDLNDDSQVDVGDIMSIINYMVNPAVPSDPTAPLSFDLNGDGQVDVGDIMVVINIMAR